MAPADPVSAQQFSLSSLAAAVVAEGHTVESWSETARELLGWTAEEVCGRPVRELLADPEDWARVREQCVGTSWEGEVVLRHAAGHELPVGVRVILLRAAGAAPSHLVFAARAEHLSRWRQNYSLVEGLFAQERIGLALFDPELRIVRTNLPLLPYTGLPGDVAGLRLKALLQPSDAAALEEWLQIIMTTGEPVLGANLRLRTLVDPRVGRLLSVSGFRLRSTSGRLMGAAAAFTDVTEHEEAGRRLDLLHRATAVLGSELSVTRTTEDLAGVLAPAMADCVVVGLAEEVLGGDEPVPNRNGELTLRRTAVAGDVDPDTLPTSALVTVRPQSGDSAGGVILGDLPRPSVTGPGRETEPRAEGEETAPHYWAPRVPGAHSALSAPLRARGAFLGNVTLWRTGSPSPFTAEELALLEEIAARAGLAVDNARRYTREHRAAVSLQRSLLPPSTASMAAVETASLYLPAGAGGGGVSGDWFDVIPLSSARVGLVVGDVVGHGLQATVTMGRLRTAVRTLADLDLDPEELLSHLDDLVTQLDVASSDEGRQQTRESLGATCLYAVYDPVTRRCVCASAGHPPPALVTGDGEVTYVDVQPGPPLGVSALPFEPVELNVPQGSVLALYTDGLVELARGDIGEGMAQLARYLREADPVRQPLVRTAERIVGGLPDEPLSDDVTLLLARTRGVAHEDTAAWTLAADPASVPEARELATAQLGVWGLEALTFTTELVTSELITNAVRYGGGGPVELRLTRADTLICEVSDLSSTQPRMRRARATDEGGRGLYLVAQLTHRWGSRYTRRGKTIWTEQLLTPPGTTAWL
ncbi:MULTISPECIES: SpoIIE family protein phosphatase [unclassified Streptomyces]|uniref:SpoIIE family protein phosphatase n=1 Tax=unclassified Streptomyces TaxID=2593676 RepID=UPI0022B6E266|nr:MULTISPECIES: SpoIIE family protein phosphatase [unclassified Streptomyces]MCZ7417822.1 SpoIIE family protein phosphatase [Streptomyces sp. WMMC897]MCZ7432373.1 SpoIIE family protein phosphatase [Streptomyces sp. WMMC1477]